MRTDTANSEYKKYRQEIIKRLKNMKGVSYRSLMVPTFEKGFVRITLGTDNTLSMFKADVSLEQCLDELERA